MLGMMNGSGSRTKLTMRMVEAARMKRVKDCCQAREKIEVNIRIMSDMKREYYMNIKMETTGKE
jgi:hypothetical protein